MYRKRERTQNWTLDEKMFLLELVKSRLDVLENKRIDSASSAMKGMAWQEIHAEFSARFGSDRDAHRVREQWRRMKGQSRIEMLEFAERVRTYGSEVANQRRPPALAEDVWKTLELARRFNTFRQSISPGDEVPSPIHLDDDEDEDGDDSLMEVGVFPGAGLGGDLLDRLGGAASDRGGDAGYVERGENGIKMEEVDIEAERDWEERLHAEDGGDGDTRGARDQRTTSPSTPSARAFVGMLRPKVELNDVPELDTSMVPSGLSITAVRMNSGHKRRIVERLDLRDHHRDSPTQQQPCGTRMPPSPVGNHHHQQQHHLKVGVNNHNHLDADVGTRAATATASAGRTAEQRRRLQMLEEEHAAKMELLRVEKQTAEIRRRIALQDEARQSTCRSCGADRESRSRVKPVTAEMHAKGLGAAVRRAESEAGDGERDELDLDNDASSLASVLASAPSAASRVSDDDVRSTLHTPVITMNGLKEDDTAEDDKNQVRFVGGLGEPGSGAGKGGGSGGSIRDAGGSMGKREAALEDEYFYKQQREQLKKLKSDLSDEIGFHEEQIKRHQEAIARHKQRVSDLDKDN